jgi:hypothetical protein
LENWESDYCKGTLTRRDFADNFINAQKRSFGGTAKPAERTLFLLRLSAFRVCATSGQSVPKLSRNAVRRRAPFDF